MSVEDIVRILGAVGVTVSIVFASLQIRGSNTALRAAANHNISMSFISMWQELASNAELLDIILRSGHEFRSLTKIEQSRASFQFMIFMRMYENAYLQRNLGVLKEPDW